MSMSDQQCKIILKAKELFMRYGFKSVSVDDISKQAGISKKTLYENFEDKDEIVLKCVDAVDDEMEAKEKVITKQSTNAIEEAIGHMINMETFIGSMNPSCMMDLQKYYPQALDQFHSNKERIIVVIKANIKRGIKEGYYRKSINVDYCAWFRFESIFYLMQSAYFTKHFNITEAHVETMQHFLYGISTIEGHQLIEQYITKHKKKK